jgi:hypothetical protein
MRRLKLCAVQHRTFLAKPRFRRRSENKNGSGVSENSAPREGTDELRNVRHLTRARVATAPAASAHHQPPLSCFIFLSVA